MEEQTNNIDVQKVPEALAEAPVLPQEAEVMIGHVTASSLVEPPKAKPWSLQKGLQKRIIPSANEIRSIVERIPTLRTKCLFVMAYLTAGRVSELVKDLKKKHIERQNIKGRDIMLITMPNRKHKKRHYKQIPIPFDKEGDLLNYILAYIHTLNWEDVLFDITRTRAYQLIRKYSGFNCHFIRHIRATHLITIYDLNSQILKMYMGWTDIRPAEAYLELRVQDIIDQM